jgi:pimeloyl-ACP methyl ester carboxylesterase
MSGGRSVFKSLEFKKQYLELYDAVLAQWNVPVESVDIKTRYGNTRINIAGPKGSPPLLLLPGFGANSTAWFPNAAALSAHFRLFAVDTNGQPGRSVPEDPLKPSNSSDWITKILDALEIESLNLAGISLGGWLALQFAIQKPERTNRVVLLDPAASFEGMSRTFFFHSLFPFMIHPTRAGLVRYFRWMTRGSTVDKNWGELMVLGILNTRPQPPIRATPFSDADLRQLKTPVLLLIGERSVIYNPQRVYQRARKLIPGIQAEIVPNASHGLNYEAVDLVNNRMLGFFNPKR